MWSSSQHITNEEKAFRQLLQKFQPLLISIISKKISARDDIKDVFQNVHIQLWKNREKLYAENVEAILVNICKQKIVEFYRKNTQRKNHCSIDENI